MKKNILTSAIVSTLLFATCGAFAAEINPGPLTTADAAPIAGVNRAPSIDATALQRAQAKLAHAIQVTHRFDASANAQGMSSAWRYEMVANLMKGDESSFASVESAADVSDAMGRSVASSTQVSSAAGSAKDLGTVSSDLVYVPLTPCRILDTRAGGAGGIIGAGQTKTYNYAAVNTGAGGCGVSSAIPGGAFTPAAEAVNVTVDETGLTGFPSGAYIAIFPQGGSAGTSFLNFGPNQILANAGVISINQTNGQFSILASAPANVLVDVFGVFIPPQATALDCVNTAPSTAIALDTTTRNGFASAPACAAGYTRVATFNNASGDFYNGWTTVVNDGSGFFHYSGGTSVNYTVYAKCCRVPGR